MTKRCTFRLITFIHFWFCPETRFNWIKSLSQTLVNFWFAFLGLFRAIAIFLAEIAPFGTCFSNLSNHWYVCLSSGFSWRRTRNKPISSETALLPISVGFGVRERAKKVHNYPKLVQHDIFWPTLIHACVWNLYFDYAYRGTTFRLVILCRNSFL